MNLATKKPGRDANNRSGGFAGVAIVTLVRAAAGKAGLTRIGFVSDPSVN